MRVRSNAIRYPGKGILRRAEGVYGEAYQIPEWADPGMVHEQPTPGIYGLGQQVTWRRPEDNGINPLVILGIAAIVGGIAWMLFRKK